MAHEARLDDEVDIGGAILVVSSAFLASVVDEEGQEVAFGASVFRSRAARERLRAELRRMSRAAFNVR
jgi:hypothetical protein